MQNCEPDESTMKMSWQPYGFNNEVSYLSAKYFATTENGNINQKSFSLSLLLTYTPAFNFNYKV